MIGITEAGDASVDFGWKAKVYDTDFTILITKHISNKFIQEVMNFKDKVIIHCTVTGFGGSKIEPNVISPEKSHEQVLKLIEAGFPVNQLVLRVDPIIPTDKGIMTARKVLDLFKDTGIRRVRYSFLDLYTHVVYRFKDEGIKLPYKGFTAPAEMRNKCITNLHSYSNYEFESCAEFNNDKLGCISKKDYDIMGVEFKQETVSKQRKGCSCMNKKELLSNKCQCPHGCLYCYWQSMDDVDTTIRVKEKAGVFFE